MMADSSCVLGSFMRESEPPFLGFVRNGHVVPLAVVDPTAFPAGVTLRQLLEKWGGSLIALKTAVAGVSNARTRIPIADLRACAPLPDARQVFCVGANYRRHVVEMVIAVGLGLETEGMDAKARRIYGEAYVARQLKESEPFIFMKPVTSIAGPRDDLLLPNFSEKADWELELGAVIGRDTFQVALGEALSCVAGYMIVNDLTARDKVRRTDPGALSLDWVAAKGAPGFLPTGPYFVPAEFIPNPQDMKMRLSVNGEVMQESSTSDMTFSIARQVSFISRYARMLPGDILCTGSPAGNGVARGRFLKHDDVMVAEIEGLGRQVVRCLTAPSMRSDESRR
jgi:2,4-didehydro-3-deoxy-L-rhamnonate hydrolase